jgi:hypothetical protein
VKRGCVPLLHLPTHREEEEVVDSMVSVSALTNSREREAGKLSILKTTTFNGKEEGGREEQVEEKAKAHSKQDARYKKQKKQKQYHTGNIYGKYTL